ncbi:MAG TPA: tRNA (adenosine(37)-N6)-threonylcarbamoyltransferase complex dimerization subunit type 1 TsaB [Sphingomonas sp.]|uniref:tRNA (adenosine(37)-N6)-threonylcarbamoyltransferase complex dimerization subunit type 1 TsaB n=1 Tax=Sphingomonas sp. TaxID=28214 RepID=UPI002ED7B2CB
MRVLVLDAATDACSVALIANGTVLASRHAVVGRGHAERLVPMVDDLLGDVRPDAVLVDCGPGSFTGVRVGLAAARAFAFAWQVPVQGYSALALLAATALVEDPALRGVTAAIIGGHGELFVQRFTGPELIAQGELRSLVPADAARFAEDDLVVGSGAPALLVARGDHHGDDRLPIAANAVHLPPAFTHLPATPIYGRAPDAKPAA